MSLTRAIDLLRANGLDSEADHVIELAEAHAERAGAAFTLFVCPSCGYWHGASEGLHAEAGHCPQCLMRRKEAQHFSVRKFISGHDVAATPRMVPMEVERV